MKNGQFELPAAYSLPVLEEVCGNCRMSEDFELLADAAGKIAADPELAAYACSLYKEFTAKDNWASFADHYRPVDKLGDAADAIFLLTVLSGMPTALKRYRDRGIPEEVIADTLDFMQREKNGKTKKKFPGLHPLRLSFCRHYYLAEIYRLGRFLFKPHDKGRDLPAVLINKRDPAKKILLASDQTFYDDRGFMTHKNATWIARISITEKGIRGHLILADGTASRTQESFLFDEWTMQYGAREVLDMHIPAGGGMTPELSRTSLKMAFEFFAGKNAVVHCNSWVFNPDLQNLPGTKNITALMKMGHLFPVKSTGKDGMFFLFGRETDELSELPRETTLQRSLIDYMRQGGRLRSGGIFFFPDEL